MAADTSVSISTFDRYFPFGLPPADCPEGIVQVHVNAGAAGWTDAPYRLPWGGLRPPPLSRLEPGRHVDFRTADDLVDASHGRLVWAKDRDDKWWIVRREDRDDVELACCSYTGPGMRYGNGDAPQSDTPVDLDDIQYLRGAGRTLVGPYPWARVVLRSGQICTPYKGQCIIDQSNGALCWAQDGRGDWWAVLRSQRDLVQTSRNERRSWDGAGVRLFDRTMHGVPLGEGDIDWLNRVASPFIGDDEGACFVLRPGIDGWSLPLAHRLAERSRSVLNVLQDRMGNSYLIDARDRSGFERSWQPPAHSVRLPWGANDRSHDFTVALRQVMWINDLVSTMRGVRGRVRAHV